MTRERFRKSASGPEIEGLIGVFGVDGALYEANSLGLYGGGLSDDGPFDGEITFDIGRRSLADYKCFPGQSDTGARFQDLRARHHLYDYRRGDELPREPGGRAWRW